MAQTQTQARDIAMELTIGELDTMTDKQVSEWIDQIATNETQAKDMRRFYGVKK